MNAKFTAEDDVLIKCVLWCIVRALFQVNNGGLLLCFKSDGGVWFCGVKLSRMLRVVGSFVNRKEIRRRCGVVLGNCNDFVLLFVLVCAVVTPLVKSCKTQRAEDNCSPLSHLFMVIGGGRPIRFNTQCI